MWLQINNIDLKASRVSLVVDPGDSDSFLTRLDSVVCRCAIEGFKTVRIYYRDRTTERDVARLEEFAAKKRLPAPEPENLCAGEYSGGNGTDFQIDYEPVHTGTGGDTAADFVSYRIRASRLEDAVENINKALAVIGTSVDLDPRSTLQLRLCIYELVMNTVEHGKFSRGISAIDLELVFDETSVLVVYRDNSEPYLTMPSSGPGLIREKISTREKRGLGLYMIDKLCSDFRHEHENEWNRSSFSLEISREHTLIEKG